MELEAVMKQLALYGNEQTKKIYLRHGAKEPLFGVKIGDIKKIQKATKKSENLALELFDTANADAMYLACLLMDSKSITREILNNWVVKATWYNISEYGVAKLAGESNFALDLGLEWIKSENEHIASAGWSTLSNLLSVKADQNIDKMLFSELLEKVQNEIHQAKNRVKYTMNGFVIAVGSYVVGLNTKALIVAHKIGKITMNMGETSCKIPDATLYINKVMHANKVGCKKKSVRR